MIYRGRVKNGLVVLDDNTILPEGQEVAIETVETKDHTMVQQPTLFERLMPFVGAAKGLPPDLAENHDHYIHGTPKQ